MKKLESRTVRELIALAREWGLSGYSKLKKAELVSLLSKKTPKGLRPKADSATLKASSTTQVEKAGQASRQARQAASRARLTPGDRPQAKTAAAPTPGQGYTRPQIRSEASKPAQPEQLPVNYRDGRMGLLARDPHWLYCFWDLTDSQTERLWREPSAAVLRVQDLSHTRPRLVETVRLPRGAQSWYVNVEDAGRKYLCELGSLDATGRFQLILSSNDSTTPPDGVSAEATVAFGPVPGGGAVKGSRATRTGIPTPDPSQAERFLALSVGAEPQAGLDSAGALQDLRQQLAGGLASESVDSFGRVPRRFRR